MFTTIWNWIANMFRNNRVIMQLAVQAIAGEFFKKHPRFKPLIGQIMTDAVRTIAGEALTVAQARQHIQERINKLTANPAEKALMSSMMDAMFAELTNYVNKEKMANVSDQVQIVVQVLGWVEEASKF